MKQRIVTGVVAAALFIPFVIYGGWPFAVLVYAMGAVAMYEMLRMNHMSIFSVPGIIGTLALFVILMPNEWAQAVEQAITYSKMELLFIAVILLLVHSVVVKNTVTFEQVAFVVLSALYIGIGFYYFIETRHAESGLQYVIFALLIVWTTDSGAYFTGRKFGKRKLWPEISPNKTVEGFVGGIVIAVVFAIIMQLITPFDTSWAGLIAVTIAASIFGQMGDLVESAIKRHFDVKDAGHILPGHGGVLDRFDSLLFVLPLLHLLHFIA